ncbi:hypothetical protein MMC13_006434 [Lambiella insularis]|nr:hypothetical protein [Lambiella insularis]
MAERTSSTHSLSRASPSGGGKASAHKLHKAHTANHGRLGHTRNPSYGKNLNKLTKLNGTRGGEDVGTQRSYSRTKLHTPSTSPSNKDLKRNSSTVSLPRVTSKTSIRRNFSNLSLKRNEAFATQLGKNGRPLTPSRTTHAQVKSKDRVTSNKSAKFTVGSEEEDEDWTGESNSQSPSTTRHSSDGARTHEGTPPIEPSVNRGHTALPDSPPESPDSDSASEAHVQSPRHDQEILYKPRPSHLTSYADADASRLLEQHASLNPRSQISSFPASDTPGTHTPPNYVQQESNLPDPSMPENGVSRFLGTTGSSSGASATANSAAELHAALTNLQSPSSAHSNRHRSRSPNPPTATTADTVRRAKSSSNIQTASAATSLSTTGSSKRSPPSYNIDPKLTRRPGGNTAAKLELWRSQGNIDSPQGPSPLAMRGALGILHPGMLGAEDRRKMLWEQAEGEMGYLRRFRNPVLEGVGRALKTVKGKGGKKAKGADAERDKERDRGRAKESRPPSVAGRRSVRFEVGGERAGRGEKDTVEQEQVVEELLRRMWDPEREEFAPSL